MLAVQGGSPRTTLSIKATMPTDVETLMTAWQDAWFTKNGRAIAEMMTDDYIYIAPNAAVMDCASILGVVTTPPTRSRLARTRRRS